MDRNPDTNQQRMDALEAKLSFQEDQIRQLSDQLYTQQRTIDRLEALLRSFRDKLGELALGNGVIQLPPQERPPHY